MPCLPVINKMSFEIVGTNLQAEFACTDFILLIVTTRVKLVLQESGSDTLIFVIFNKASKCVGTFYILLL